MSDSSPNYLKILGRFCALLLLLAVPLVLFSPIEIEKEQESKGEVHSKLYLAEPGQVDEDPRVMYEPDLSAGFSQWVFDALDLPPLERPDLKMGSPDFYTKEDFPTVLSSPEHSLKDEIRADWPLPPLRDSASRPLATLKTSDSGFIILSEGVEQDDLISEVEFNEAMKGMPAGSLNNMSLFAVELKAESAEVVLIKTCGWRELDNLLGKKVFERYNKQILRESISSGKAIEWAKTELHYLAEWRSGLPNVKK